MSNQSFRPESLLILAYSSPNGYMILSLPSDLAAYSREGAEFTSGWVESYSAALAKVTKVTSVEVDYAPQSAHPVLFALLATLSASLWMALA